MRSAEAGLTPWLLCGALALGLVAQLLLPAPPLPLAPMRRDHALSAAPVAPPPVIGAFEAIVDHPLFAPGRSSKGGASPDLAAPGSFALLGVAVDRGGASAVIRSGQDPQVVRLGSSLKGWRVSAIGRDMAVLDHDGTHQRLILGAPATTPPPSLPPGQSQ